MQIPDNVDKLLDDTPFGRVTVEIHRAYNQTQTVKTRTRQQVKTDTIEEAGGLVGQYLGEIIRLRQSGHLDVQITFKDGVMKFTHIEAFID